MSIGTIVIYVSAIIALGILLNLGVWWGTIRLFDKIGSRLKLELYVAVRHMRGRKSGFLTLIGILSILAVSVSSCNLVTVLSVMGGFSGDLKQKILKTNAHVVVDHYGGDIENWRDLIDKVRDVPGVVAATPIVQGEMMMNARTNNHAILLKGVELKSFVKVSGVLENLEKGKLEYLENPAALFSRILEKRRRLYGLGDDTDTASTGDSVADKDSETEGDEPPSPYPTAVSPKQKTLPSLIVGQELSRSLRLYVGEEVNIISPLGDVGPTGPIPKSRPFRVGGVFFSGMYEFDSLFVYTALEAAQKFMRKGDRISEIQIAVADPDAAGKTAKRIEAAIGDNWRVRSWAELNASLFSALKLEKIVMFIFLCLAILVASFCVIATLTMLVLEKSAEVSVLMTLGASVSQIGAIFRLEGLLIGAVGTVCGLLVGFALCLGLELVGLPIDPEVWYIDKLPVDMEWIEFVLVGVASLVITQLATLYPAYAAARLNPVEGLKNDA